MAYNFPCLTSLATASMQVHVFDGSSPPNVTLGDHAAIQYHPWGLVNVDNSTVPPTAFTLTSLMAKLGHTGR